MMMTRGGGATGIQWVKARGVSNHPAVLSRAPHNEELSGQNISSAEVEKLLWVNS